VPIVLNKYNPKKIIIFSRDEMKQWEMAKKFPNEKRLRFFIGDVRDKDRLMIALRDVDHVIHAAAIKQVDSAEYNPIEYIKTNIIGAQNLIEASIEKKVKKLIALSTDKASSPINLYGATKLCSDKLFVSANNYAGENIFSVVRYGNVFGSRGSVAEVFNNAKKSGIFLITDKRMTRFNITLNQSVEMVKSCLKISIGGEIFIPKIKSYKILDLVKAYHSSPKIKLIGIRPGEKIHEEMISQNESRSTYDIGKFYCILPEANNKIINFYKKFKKVPDGFNYSSDNNHFLKIKEIEKIIKNENKRKD
jgi:UDP-N-acetylglucosamine 4,6-dehydratase (inverting)